MPAADRPHHPADLALLVEAAEEAARVALGYFGRNPSAWKKAGDSPVSEADIAVDRLLHARLRAARPDYGWLSEETEDDPDRLRRERVFVVDPIDGTRSFLEGRRDWTVSLAVVVDGRPESAVLVAPALGETYVARRGGGALLNGGAIRVSEAPLAGARLAGPKRYLRAVAAAAGAEARDIRFVGSLAYRLVLVAAGRAEVSAGRSGARDWDLAAADLLVQEAGGVVLDLEGHRLSYNHADTRHLPVIAGAAALVESARALIESEVGEAIASG